MVAVLAVGFLSEENHGDPLWVSQVSEEVLSDESWGCSKCPQGLLSSSSGKGCWDPLQYRLLGTMVTSATWLILFAPMFISCFTGIWEGWDQSR